MNWWWGSDSLNRQQKEGVLVFLTKNFHYFLTTVVVFLPSTRQPYFDPIRDQYGFFFRFILFRWSINQRNHNSALSTFNLQRGHMSSLFCSHTNWQRWNTSMNWWWVSDSLKSSTNTWPILNHHFVTKWIFACLFL